MQVLEGQSLPLAALLQKIEADERHSVIHIIYKAFTPSRIFAQWNMGYFNIEQYYQINRCDVAQLRRYVEKTFMNNETAQEAIV